VPFVAILISVSEKLFSFRFTQLRVDKTLVLFVPFVAILISVRKELFSFRFTQFNNR
jgi:hypothetical protein